MTEAERPAQLPKPLTQRLHPDDLAALLSAVSPSPPQEPSIPRGYDAATFQRAVESMVREKVDPFLTREQIGYVVRDAIAQFLTREQIRELVDERLERIGLRVDEKHVDDTAESMRWLTRWHRLVSRILLGVIGTLLTGILYALAKKIGIPLASGDS